MAGDELPFKGFVLIPEHRLLLLEKTAAAARDLLARHMGASKDVRQAGSVETALKALGDSVSDLEKVWDIPQWEGMKSP